MDNEEVIGYIIKAIVVFIVVCLTMPNLTIIPQILLSCSAFCCLELFLEMFVGIKHNLHPDITIKNKNAHINEILWNAYNQPHPHGCTCDRCLNGGPQLTEEEDIDRFMNELKELHDS